MAGAGVVQFDEEGRVLTISNASGHYKPEVVYLIQTVELLLKRGALLDKEWSDAAGNLPTKTAAELVNAVKAAEAKAVEMTDEVREWAGQLGDETDPARSEQQQAELVRLKGLLDAKLGQLDQARRALAKLGVAPKNKYRNPEEDDDDFAYVPKVEVIRPVAGMDGSAVRNAEDAARKNALPVADFLMTGGGDKTTVADIQSARSAMYEELKSVTAARAARLNPDDSKLTPEELTVLTDKVRRRVDASDPDAVMAVLAKRRAAMKLPPRPAAVVERMTAELEAVRTAARKYLESVAEPTVERLEQLLAELTAATGEVVDPPPAARATDVETGGSAGPAKERSPYTDDISLVPERGESAGPVQERSPYTDDISLVPERGASAGPVQERSPYTDDISLVPEKIDKEKEKEV